VCRCGLDSSGLGEAPVAGPCEHGHEPSSSIKYREFLLASEERLCFMRLDDAHRLKASDDLFVLSI
jgi:hypothetical protein